MRRVRLRPVALLLAAVSALALPVAAGAAADPYRPSQWGLDRIGAPDAWATGRGQGHVIAVIDTGVDLTHPDLVDRLFRDAEGRVVGRDLIDDDGLPQDENGHGTMVAGIAAAAADNGIGIAGVAPRARIMPIRVLDASGRGTARDVDEGIRWAVDNGATVVNLSLESVAPLPGTIVTQAPDEAVRYAWSKGVAVIAAAGNSGAPFTDYPDSSPVVLVGASTRDDERANFSDTGRRDALLAPGVEIVSTWCDPTPQGCNPKNRYGQADGTSFAAPAVAGAVAVLRSAGLDSATAVKRLRDTAEDLGPAGPDATYGYGRLDLARATATMGTAGSPTSTTSPKPRPSASPTAAATSAPSSPPAEPDAPAPPSEPTAPPSTEPATPAATPPSEADTGAPAPAPSATDPGVGEDVTPLGTLPPDASGGAAEDDGPSRDLLLAVAIILLGLATSGVITFWRDDRHGA